MVAVLVMDAVLAAITVLLLIAERLLVTYGECTLTVVKGREQRKLKVRGGGTLLGALVDNHVEVSSSCGGRGTCGYCKCRVVRGGGELLPTEEVFMSRADRSEGMRLACQVKVKEDLEVVIPDFLTVVRAMVQAHKFDARKRWRVTIK